MPREIDCSKCGGMGYWDIKGNRTRKCPNCKDGKIKVYIELEVQELIKQEREECALICDNLSFDDLDYTPLECAEAIRQRGE